MGAHIRVLWLAIAVLWLLAAPPANAQRETHQSSLTNALRGTQGSTLAGLTVNDPGLTTRIR